MINDEKFRDKLLNGALHYGVSLDNDKIECFEQYTALLSEWNARTNLISSRDLGRLVEYHLLDSLKVLNFLDMNAVSSILDFGSGPGLPGIPFAIAFPHIKVTLVEPRNKRFIFLEHAVKELSLRGCSVIKSRIETLPARYNDSFDLVITRATVSLKRFYEVSLRFAATRGTLCSIKGSTIDTEYRELLHSVDRKSFHVESYIPEPWDDVRQGTVVCITRK